MIEQLDEGDVVGHRIIELETSRKIAAAAAAGQAGRHMAQDPPTPSHSRQHLSSDFSGRDRSMPVCDYCAPLPARRCLAFRVSRFACGHDAAVVASQVAVSALMAGLVCSQAERMSDWGSSAQDAQSEAEKRQLAAQEERLRRHHMQVLHEVKRLGGRTRLLVWLLAAGALLSLLALLLC